MSLPFTYAAKVLPSRRHRIPDSVIVRAYTDVLVPELSASEISPAIVLERGQARSTLFDWTGRLFRPARRRSNGKPLSVEDFQLEVSERFADIHGLVVHKDVDFDTSLFPTSNSRWNVGSIRSGESTPLSFHTIEAWRAERRWKAPIAEESAEDCERGRAQALYAETFIVVDGALYVACPEPVWAIRARPRQLGLCLEEAPSLADAAHCFRLDEYQLAMSWADQVGVGVVDDERRVNILSGGGVRRDCLLHVARAAVTPLLHFASWPLPIAEPIEGAVALCERLDHGAIAPEMSDVSAILDAVVALYRVVEERIPAASNYGWWPEIRCMVRRWAFEQARGEDLSRYSQLSDDDIEALHNL